MNDADKPAEPGASKQALRLSLQNAVVMAVFALLFTAMMAGTYLITRPAIERSSEQEKLRLINEVLPPQAYDNDLLKDVLVVQPTPALGLTQGGLVWRARKAGQPVAVVLEVIAPDGYSGPIRMVLAVHRDGSVGGVRVVSHKETPGLGDYIDPKKDRNKTRPWISQFDGHSLAAVTPQRWQVKKDGGQFDAMSGATVSARAVTRAVGRALEFVAANRDALFSTAQ